MVKSIKKLDVPLSGLDLKNLFGQMKERSNLTLMKDIKPSWDIEKILNGSGHAVLFIEHEGQDIGHFTCLVRHHKKNGKNYNTEGEAYYFDSLGDAPPKNLVDVVLKHYPKLLWNDIQFQKDHESSCGRWATAIATLNKLGMSPHEIEDLLKNTKHVNDFIIKTFQE